MRGGHLIYQSIAEPIKISAAAETVTVDKWYRQHPNPVLRNSLSSAIVAGSFFFLNTINANDANARVPEWHPQINQPERLVSKLPRQHTGESRFEVPRDILLSDWFNQTSQPRIVKFPQLLGGETRTEVVAPAQEDITVDKWFQPVSQPFFSKKRQYFGITAFTDVPRTILLSDWFAEIKQPRIIRRPQLLGGEARTEIVVELNKWFAPTQQPLILRRRVTLSGATILDVPRTVLLTDWFAEIRQPYFSKKRQLLGGETRFEIPRDILLTDWFVPTVEIIRRAMRQQNDSAYVLYVPAPETITLDKWFAPIVQPFLKFKRNPFGDFILNLFEEEQVDDPTVYDCCIPVIVPFTNAGTLVIPYSLGMRNAYGDIPTVMVYHFDGAELIKAAVRVTFINNPATEIRIDNGGLASGYVRIST
jgi:hypothetical protein